MPELLNLNHNNVVIPIGVSNRHMHLSQKHLEILFGKEYKLTPQKYLKQPGEFAAKETVTLVGPKGVIERVRILGPTRDKSQVEISRTDGFRLGVEPPVRESGDLEGTPGIVVVGPNGAVTLKQGVILAARHIHAHREDAKVLGLEDGDLIRVKSFGPRSVILDNVLVRVSPKYKLELHVDTDEANAALLKNGDVCTILH